MAVIFFLIGYFVVTPHTWVEEKFVVNIFLEINAFCWRLWYTCSFAFSQKWHYQIEIKHRPYATMFARNFANGKIVSFFSAVIKAHVMVCNVSTAGKRALWRNDHICRVSLRPDKLFFFFKISNNCFLQK